MPADFISTDIPDFFAEFAELVVFEGLSFAAVVEPQGYAEHDDGSVERWDVRLFVATSELADLDLAVRQNVTLNNKNYIVQSRQENMGVTELQLVTGRGI